MNKSNRPLKQFIVRKLVLAESITEALKKEPGTEVEEVYVNNDYKAPESPKEFGYK